MRAGNDVKLYVNGSEAYPRMNDMIAGAQQRIDLEFFGFYPDEGGDRMVERLIAKAKSGVQVNVLVDMVACRSLHNQPLLDPLTAAGVNVTQFTNGYNSHPLLHAFQITDHRKVLVVDGHTAMTGGMNLGVSYEKYWHDFMVEVQGPTLGDMVTGFEKNWALSQGKPLRPITVDTTTKGGLSAQVALTSPKVHEIKNGMIAAFDHASSHIMINSPYYVDKDVMAALERAAQRGVTVTAIVPTVGDSPVIDYMNKMMTNELLAAGVKVFLYDTTNADFPKHDHITDHFNHGKLATVDGQWTTIGTANVDTRSMNANQEININVDSPEFARTIETRVFETDLNTKCQPATVTVFSPWSAPKRWLMKKLRFLLFAF
jgi:cardiolipin synthase